MRSPRPREGPPAPRTPIDCLQSARNYPHLTAAALSLSVTDRSCSSATTANMTSAQIPRSAAAVQRAHPLDVTGPLGIGGNDNQLLVSAIAACSATDVLDVLNIGAPCQGVLGNYFVNQANADGPAAGAAIPPIHVLAPAAKVFVLGYPASCPNGATVTRSFR